MALSTLFTFYFETLHMLASENTQMCSDKGERETDSLPL